MIIYLTKQTVDRYGINMPEKLDEAKKIETLSLIEASQDKPLFVWGGKLFYLGGKKCLQLVNFASKLSIFMFFVNKSEISSLDLKVLNYLYNLYEQDDQMLKLLDLYRKDLKGLAFGPLKDKRVIATLNKNQREVVDFGIIDEFVEDGMIDSTALNRFQNLTLASDMINGKRDYIYPLERFEELLKEYYSGKQKN